MKTFFIVEASHLFRAGDKFQTQFFVLDVVNFLRQKFPGESHVMVLHGSVKQEQAIKYAGALERRGVQVIRMNPIPSQIGDGKVYYKPTFYLHKMMGKEIPEGSTLVLVGFHNPRYIGFLQKYARDYRISMAAFTTPSKKQGWMSIPDEFAPFLREMVTLDESVPEIKAQFRKKKQ